MLFDLLFAFNELATGIWNFIAELWWLWLFLILFFAARELWLGYAQAWWKRHEIEWMTLEMRIPREVRQGPRAMEQVLLALHELKNSPSTDFPPVLMEKYWGGEVSRWFGLEIASFGGEIHFYLRIHKPFRNAVEAAFYAHYPDVELVEAPDYVGRLPAQSFAELDAKGYRLFGNELLLKEKDAIPIRTYPDYGKDEKERELDPISLLLEVLAKLSPSETVALQILIRPVDDTWKKESEKLIEKMIKEQAEKSQVKTTIGGTTYVERTPGETEVLKAVQRNIAKPGFDTVIRYLYMAPPDTFSGAIGRNAIMAAFNQYSAQDLNQFRPNYAAWTRLAWYYPPFFFQKRRLRLRSERIYRHYIDRFMPEESLALKLSEFHPAEWGTESQKQKMVLNTEEIATIYHPPTSVVLTGPTISRVESRKVGPPAGLPIFGGGEELPGVSS